MNDQVALAEAHAGLELVGELTACAQFGDDRGAEVWMQRYRCVASHWDDLETPAPDRNV
jgi:hypothetical protein